MLLVVSLQPWQKAFLLPSYKHTFRIERPQKSLTRAFSSPYWTTNTLTACPQRRVLQLCDNFCDSLLDLLLQVHVFLGLGASELDAVLQIRCVEVQNHFPQPLGHCSFDVWRWLPFWTISTQYWVMPNLLFFNTPKFFSAGVFLINSSSSLYWYWGLFQLMWRILHLILLNFMSFTWPCRSSDLLQPS